jgi:hypothetical protein
VSAKSARKNKSQATSPWDKAQKPLRIVPLHPAPRAAALGAPQLTYRGGPLLSAVEIFTVFWGKAWQDAANSDLMRQMNAFFDFVVNSKLLDQMSEYSTPGNPIGHGRRIGTLNLVSSEPGTSVADSAIQTLLQREISAGTLPATTKNTLYFVFLPPGTQVAQGGSASCKDFCGYHDVAGGGIYYAVMPYPGCSGCQGGLTTLEALTSTSSHELCEAITDPIPGQGWYDDSFGEIGDICAWKTKVLDGYTVQLEWSNSAKACV